GRPAVRTRTALQFQSAETSIDRGKIRRARIGVCNPALQGNPELRTQVAGHPAEFAAIPPTPVRPPDAQILQAHRRVPVGAEAATFRVMSPRSVNLANMSEGSIVTLVAEPQGERAIRIGDIGPCVRGRDPRFGHVSVEEVEGQPAEPVEAPIVPPGIEETKPA